MKILNFYSKHFQELCGNELIFHEDPGQDGNWFKQS